MKSKKCFLREMCHRFSHCRGALQADFRVLDCFAVESFQFPGISE